jgi:Cdc6-like AAA superfamily ATPase
LSAKKQEEILSIDLARKALNDFIRTDTPETICVRGKWGVGKTHAWETFIKTAISNHQVGLPYYSYVSLFGINSIDAFRQDIFEHLDPTTPGSKPFELKDRLGLYLRRGAQFTSRIADYAHVPLMDTYLRNFAGGFRHVVSLTVQRAIVCVDDFERKGSGLRVTDILGVISDLKERKKCKVLLIMNTDALSDDDKSEFEKYFEKSIDASITFAPTPEEIAAIGLNTNTVLYEFLRDDCLRLKISNIRVVRKD